MKTTKILIAIITFTLMCINTNAQINRVNRAVHRGAERAVEKKAEEKAEETVSKELDKGLEKAEAERQKGEAEAEKGINKGLEKLDEIQKNNEEAGNQIAGMLDEIPEVGNAPYTPKESEYTFFAMKKGSVQVYANKDAKGKVTSQSRNRINDITGEKNAFAIYYDTESLDDKGKPNSKDPMLINYRVVVKDGIMYLDTKAMFGDLEGMNDVVATGTTMRIPNNLTVGQAVPDAKAAAKIGFMNCVVAMTEGKCVAFEDVTVEAGTFKCYKVSYKINSTVLGVKKEGTSTIWYAKGVGEVKVETIDKNGKLVATKELKSNL